MKSNWLRGGTAPKIARSGVSHGVLTRAERIRNIERERIRRERRGKAAELLADARKEIAASKQQREKVKQERAAIDQAIQQSVQEFPAASMKIKRDKNGAPFVQRRFKGKFLPSVKVEPGFTLTELLVCLIGVVGVTLTIGLIFVAIHFVSKFW